MPEIFKALEKVRPIYDWTDKVLMALCKLLLIADVAITSMAVAGRYISFIPDPAWSEQMVLTLMVYMAVLSAALAIRKKAHIRMTALDRYLPKKLLEVLDFAADLAVTALALVMLVVGWNYANTVGIRGFYTSMTWLSKKWMYYPIPLAGLVMIIFEIEQLTNDVLILKGKEANA